MKNIKRSTVKAAPAVLAALAAIAISASAGAVTPVPFQQNSGFYQGLSADGVLQATICAVTGCPTGPEAGKGGLDFFTLITPVAPVCPAGAPGTCVSGPFAAYMQVEWGGVNTDGAPVTAYANNGVRTPGPSNATHPGGGWGVPTAFGYDATREGRSSFEVEGLSSLSEGSITGPGFTNITLLVHHNHTIDGNLMQAVDVTSWFQLGTANVLVDGPAPSLVSVNFTESYNFDCTAESRRPVDGAPINPLGTTCDDYAVIDGFDLASKTIEAGALGNGEPSERARIEFQLLPATDQILFPSSKALVCPGGNLKPDQTQDIKCTIPQGQKTSATETCTEVGGCPYAGPDVIVYTGEDGDNGLYVQARLIPEPLEAGVPLFVIGNCEYEQWKLKKGQTPPADNGLRDIGQDVNFWGAQWWKNNCMSEFTSNGYPSFKGYATNVVFDGTPNCGRWQARPGNSGHPPATLPDLVSIIVTDNVTKIGPNISGNIIQIVTVDRTKQVTGVPKDRYAGNPGHAGSGEIVAIECGPGAPPPIVPES